MFQVLAFIRYWLLQADEHSLHSPFVFNLFKDIIKNASLHEIKEIEFLRSELIKNKNEIELIDFGAGSRVSNMNKRAIGDIAKYSTTPAKFSALLKALITHFDYTNIIELGTSLGLNTLYISDKPETIVKTFEGDPIISSMAREHFKQFNRLNIELIEGNIDETLEIEIQRFKSIDLAYLDANHRYEPSLKYYETISTKCHEKSLIVLDDIHWSKEMNDAWNEIKNRPEVVVSIDLFEGGLLFFDPKLTPGNYILEF